jgi:hypothetical protein
MSTIQACVESRSLETDHDLNRNSSSLKRCGLILQVLALVTLYTKQVQKRTIIFRGPVNSADRAGFCVSSQYVFQNRRR